MADIICLMSVAEDQVSFTWSQGPASFEPYHLQRQVFADFKELAKEARSRLSDLVVDCLHNPANVPPASLALAEAGYELYQQIFDPGAGQAHIARQVRKWLEGMTRTKTIDSFEIVLDSPWSIPWNVVYDEKPDQDAFLSNDEDLSRWKPFWAIRYDLTGGRKVSPLRRMPQLQDPHVLMVIAPEIRAGLPQEQRHRLDEFVRLHQLKVASNKTELEAEMKSERPDLIYWLSHASAAALVLGDEEITPRQLRKLLRNNDSDDPYEFGGIAFLNACQTAERSEAGSFFDALHSVGFSGMIGTEHETIDTFANRLGLDFLEGFLIQREPMGKVMRGLRARVPLGLLYGTYCPPDLQVAETTPSEGGISGTSVKIVRARYQAGARLGAANLCGQEAPMLPEEPYRSLAYYGYKDRALFAGRDKDVERFSRLLDDTGARIIILHGESGVGKSSFLRAGVVPYLEEECLGYEFLREESQQQPTLFIRATNDLASSLAQTLNQFCARPFTYNTPAGEAVQVDLPDVLAKATAGSSAGTLRQALLENPGLLADILVEIGAQLPFSPVLVIDQCEEIFTLARSPEDIDNREAAIRLLRRVVPSSGDFKVVLSMRTEYYGRLIDRLRSSLTSDGIREYLLTDFDEEMLVEAIVRPQSALETPYSSETPYNKYGFSFEPGLPQELARRIVRSSAQREDSVLPLMQVVCNQLYQRVRHRDNKRITADDLESLGGVEGGLSRHVGNILKELFADTPSDQRPFKHLFTLLYTRQPDGSLTSALIAEDELERRWRGQTPFATLIEGGQQKRLIRVNTLRIGGQEERRYVSLGHDSLAGLAAEWDDELSRMARFRKTATVVGAAALIALVMTFLAISANKARKAAVGAKQDAVDAKKLAEGNAVKALTAEEKALAAKTLAESNAAKAVTAEEKALAAKKLAEAKTVEAVAARATAEANERESRAREFAARAIPYLEGQREPQFALEWALAGVKARKPPIVDAMTALYGAVQANYMKARLPHPGNIRAVAWSPDGQLLATACSDHQLRLWNRNGSLVFSHEHPKRSDKYSLAWSPDGQILTSLGHTEGIPRFWNRKGKLLAELKDKPARLADMKWNRSGSHLAARQQSSSVALAGRGSAALVRIWDRNGRPTAELRGHSGSTDDFSWSSDGKMLVTASRDQTARIWNLNGKTTHILKGHEKAVTKVVWNPGKPIIATGSRDATVRLWDATNGQPVKTLIGLKSGVATLSFNSSGDRLVAVSGYKTADVLLWDAAGQLIASLDRIDDRVFFFRQEESAHGGRVRQVTWSPDGTRIMTRSSGRSWLWTSDGKPLVTFGDQEQPVSQFGWSPNSRLLATWSRGQGTIQVWNAAGIRVAAMDGQLDTYGCLISWRPDSIALATTGTREVRVWDPREHPMKTLRGYREKIRFANWQPDGRTLLTATSMSMPREMVGAGPDDSLRLWDQDGELLRAVGSVRGIAQMAWNSDGTAFAANLKRTGYKIAILDAAGVIRAIVPGCVEWAWNPRHPAVATVSIPVSKGASGPGRRRFGAVRILDSYGRQIAELSAKASRISWSPDGTTLAMDLLPRAVASRELRILLSGKDGKLVKELKASSGKLDSLVWSPNSQVVAATISNKGARSVLLWNAKGKRVGQLEGLKGESSTLSWSADSRVVVSASQTWQPGPKRDEFAPRFVRQPIQTELRCWDAKGAALSEQLLIPGAIDLVSWSPDSTVLVTVSSTWKVSKEFGPPPITNAIRFWSREGRLKAKHEVKVDQLAWHPSESILATASAEDGEIRLWKTDGRAPIRLQGHERGVRAISWSPDGSRLASISADKTLRLWDRRGKPLATLGGPEWSSFPVAIRRMPDMAKGERFVPKGYLLEWSPDGTRLASTMDAKTARLWVTDVLELFWEASKKRVMSESVIPPGHATPAWDPFDPESLVKQLANGDTAERLSAAHFLSRMDKARESVIPALVAALKDSSYLVRAKASDSLGRLAPASEHVVAELIKMLKDKSLLVRRRAIWALGESGAAGAAALEALIALLSEDATQIQATIALGKLSGHRVDPLIKSLTHVAAEVREKSAKALAGNQQPGVRAALTKALSDPHDGVRIEAAIALLNANKESKTGLPIIMELLGRDDSYLRLRAVTALRRTNRRDGPTIQALGELLSDDNEEIQRQVFLTLAHMGEASFQVSRQITSALKREKICSLEAVRQTLNSIGPRAWRILFAASLTGAPSTDYRVRRLMRSLNHRPPQSELRRLFQALVKTDVSDPKLGSRIPELIREIGDPALPLLLARLDSAEDQQRLWALRVLSKLAQSGVDSVMGRAADQALAAVEKLLGHPKEQVRAEARVAYNRIRALIRPPPGKKSNTKKKKGGF